MELCLLYALTAVCWDLDIASTSRQDNKVRSSISDDSHSSHSCTPSQQYCHPAGHIFVSHRHPQPALVPCRPLLEPASNYKLYAFCNISLPQSASFVCIPKLLRRSDFRRGRIRASRSVVILTVNQYLLGGDKYSPCGLRDYFQSISL